MKRFLSLFLAVTMLVSLLPTMTLPFSAEEVTLGTVGKVSDPSTIDQWESFIGPDNKSTVNAGAVWMDKSVFADATALDDIKTSVRGYPLSTNVIDKDNNFLVSMSAIASNKSIVGYSHIPTDTMLILDVSASMSDANAQTMVNAANAAIKKLQDTNNHNRVGVVLYSGSSSTGNSGSQYATVLLPLDRYEQANDIYLVYGDKTVNREVWIEGHYEGRWPNLVWVEGHYETVTETVDNAVSINSGVTVYDDSANAYVAVAENYVEKIGGTYISNGILTAMDELLKADTVIDSGEIQGGTTRLPIMMLMSDGAPTWSRSNYTERGTSNLGNGQSGSNAIYFTTQLAAAYAKARIDAHYADTTPLFYTLGLGNSISIDTMNPEESNNTTIAGWWNSLVSRGSVTIQGNTSVTSTTVNAPDGSAATVTFPNDVSQRIYADEYFAANSSNFADVFDKIVQEIILQSRYYPTSYDENEILFDGYITFIDDIGEYMNVERITGLVINDTLYTGMSLAAALSADNVDSDSDLALGTVADPKPTGTMFVNALATRLNISRAAAIQLIDYAYKYGQLRYTEGATPAETTFSNYIGWYADADGNYISFYDEDFTETSDVPAAAKYTVRSYGFIDPIHLDTESRSSMIYCSVQVRTEIATGHQQVIWKIPAALIPTVSYDITLDKDSIEASSEILVAYEEKHPIQLVFEVGLNDDITPYNMADKVSDEYRNEDGTYTFYTNRFDESLLPSDVLSPSKEVNTVAWFEPNVMNERYYFTEDAEILVKNPDGTYTPYVGATKPTSGEYYRKIYSFTWGTNKNADGQYIADYTAQYEHVSEAALAYAVQDGTSWYVPKGTVHRHFHDNTFFKTVNATDTLKQSHYPSIESATIGGVDHYYSDLVLGNNGKLTYAPAQGLSITKKISAFEPGTEPEFTFTVTGTNDLAADGTYNATKIDAAGTATDTTVTFTGKVATVTLKKDETIHITDLPEGATYTVTELPTVNYDLIGVTVDGTSVSGTEANVTVAKRTLTDVEFTNNLDTDGELIIRKTVEHPLAATTIPDSLVFTYEVDLGTAFANQVINTTNGNVTADANGVITVTVKPGASTSVKLTDPGADVPVTVREINLPAGFTAQGENPRSVIIPKGSYVITEYVNSYSPTQVYPVNVTASATKTLTGRAWMTGDTFTFVLERRVFTADGYEFDEIARKTISAEGQTADFSAELQAEVFNAEGSYVYRIREIAGTLGGITYDAGEAFFDVTVADSDWDGKYEISDVYGHTDKVSVTTAGASWNVSASFTNAYAANDEDTATVNITKNLINNTDGISKAGFKFGIYNMNPDGTIGSLVKESPLTDDAGLTNLTLTFTAADLGKTYNYVVVEISENPISHVIYDTSEEKISVTVVDNWDGTIGAKVYAYGAAPLNADNTYELTYENIYAPTGTLHIVKNFSDHSVLNEVNPPEGLAFRITGPNGYDHTVYYTEFQKDTAGNMVYTINVPADTSGEDYTVTEFHADVAGHNRTTTHAVNAAAPTEGDAATVIVTADQESTVTFENSYAVQTGALTIYKEVSPAGLTLPEGLTFTVRDDLGNVVKTVTYAEFVNGAYTVTNLPIGNYTVEEDSSTADVTDYTLSSVTVTAHGFVTITNGNTEEVTVTNTYTQNKGSLEIVKTFNPSTVTPPAELQFTITGPNGYSDTVYYSEFVNGKYLVDDLPVGEYTVVESGAEVDGYTLVATATATATVKLGEKAVAEFTNNYTRHLGSLTVEKVFTGIPEALRTAISVTVTGEGYANTILLTSANDWTVTLTDLPTGIYTVTEDRTTAQVANYSLVTVTGEGSVTVANGATATATVTNVYSANPGTITITKDVTGDLTEANVGREFVFTVTGPDGFSDTVTLPDNGNWYAMITNLVPGDYTVTEANADVANYTVSTTYSNAGGVVTVAPGQTDASITVTNDYTVIKGSLTINKTFSGELPEAQWPAVTVKVTGPSYPDGHNVTISKDTQWKAVLTDLIPGTYTVTEDTTGLEIASYRLTVVYTDLSAGNTANVASGLNTVVGVVNIYDSNAVVHNHLPITKKVEQSTYSQVPGVGHFTVKLLPAVTSGDIAALLYNNADITVNFGGQALTPATDGAYYVTLSTTGVETVTDTVCLKGTELALDALAAAGLTFTVTEVNSAEDGWYYSIESYVAAFNENASVYSFTVTGSGSEVSFTNVYNKEGFGEVTVAKHFAGIETHAARPEIEVVITNVNNASLTYSFILNEANGWTLTRTDIPYGKYSVSEILTGLEVEDHTYVGVPSYSHNEITVTADAVSASVTVTNNYSLDKGTLTVTKDVAGDLSENDVTNVYSFTVAGPNGYTNTVQLSKANGYTVTLTDLAVGTYTVTENLASAQVAGYTLTVANGGSVTAELTKDENETVTVVNTYTLITGSVTVTKNWVGLPTDKQFEVEVTFTDANSVVTPVKLNAANNWTQTISLVPGVYTVVETTDITVSDYESTVEYGGLTSSHGAHTLTVNADGSHAVTVINAYDPIGTISVVFEITKDVIKGAFAADPVGNTTFNFTITPSTTLPAGTVIHYNGNDVTNLSEGIDVTIVDANSATVEVFFKGTQSQLDALAASGLYFTVTESPSASTDWTTSDKEFTASLVKDGSVYKFVTRETGATGESDIEFTNTYVKIGEGPVTVTKNWQGLDASVTKPEVIVNLVAADSTKIPFVLNQANSWTVTQLLPYGEYTVEETVVPVISGHTLNSTTYSARAIVHDGSAEVSVTVVNTYDRDMGQLTITKTFNPVNVPLPQNLTFEVKDETGTTVATVPYADFTNGSYTLTVATGNYTVTETNLTVDGYTFDASASTVSPLSVTVTTAGAVAAFTNVYRINTGNVTVTKNIAGDLDEATFPGAITVVLTGPETRTVTLSAANNWTAVAEGLLPGTYIVSEQNADVIGYSYTVSGDTEVILTTAGASVSLTNVYVRDKGSLTINKVITGDLGYSDIAEVKVDVAGVNYANTVTLNAANNWTVTITDLPVGNYSITEQDAIRLGYMLFVDVTNGGAASVTLGNNTNVTVTNDYTAITGNITITKTFAGDLAGNPALWPDVIVNVTDPFGSVIPVVLNASNNWTHTLTGLYPGTYKVVEEHSSVGVAGFVHTTYTGLDVNGTVEVISGHTENVNIINTYTALEVLHRSFHVTKLVKKADLSEQPALNTFTFKVTPSVPLTDVNLTLAGTHLTPNADGSYTFTVTVDGAQDGDVELCLNGREDYLRALANAGLTLTVTEVAGSDAAWTYSSAFHTVALAADLTLSGEVNMVFENTYAYYTDKNASFSVTKTVEKADVYADLPGVTDFVFELIPSVSIPTGVTVTCNGTEVTAVNGIYNVTVTVNGIGTNTVNIGLAGRADVLAQLASNLTFTVREVRSNASDWIYSNKVYTATLVRDGDSFVFSLPEQMEFENIYAAYADTEVSFDVVKTVVSNVAIVVPTDNTFAFSIIPKLNGAIYDIKAAGVELYVNGAALTPDANGAYAITVAVSGTGSATVRVTLKGSIDDIVKIITAGVQLEVKEEGIAPTDWTYDDTLYTVTPVLDTANNAVLVIKATTAEGIKDAAKAEFVNKYTYVEPPVPTVNVSVTKMWADNNYQLRPSSVTVQLFRNGAPYGTPVVLSYANAWTYMWQALPADQVWSVDEIYVPAGYTKRVTMLGTNDFLIINTIVTPPDVTEYTTLTVNKVWNDDNNPNRPASVQVQLYRDDVAYGDPVTITAENGWRYTWRLLDKSYNWRVDEVNIPENYTRTVSVYGNEYTIVNTYNTPTVNITVNKIWDDGNSADRPVFVTVQLYCNGVAYGVPEQLSELNGWTYTWKDLDNEHFWFVDELSVPDGYTKSLAIDGHTYNITNTMVERPQTPTSDDAETAFVLSVKEVPSQSRDAVLPEKKRKIK